MALGEAWWSISVGGAVADGIHQAHQRRQADSVLVQCQVERPPQLLEDVEEEVRRLPGSPCHARTPRRSACGRRSARQHVLPARIQLLGIRVALLQLGGWRQLLDQPVPQQQGVAFQQAVGILPGDQVGVGDQQVVEPLENSLIKLSLRDLSRVEAIPVLDCTQSRFWIARDPAFRLPQSPCHCETLCLFRVEAIGFGLHAILLLDCTQSPCHCETLFLSGSKQSRFRLPPPSSFCVVHIPRNQPTLCPLRPGRIKLPQLKIRQPEGCGVSFLSMRNELFRIEFLDQSFHGSANSLTNCTCDSDSTAPGM